MRKITVTKAKSVTPTKSSVTAVLDHLFSRASTSAIRCYRGQSDVTWDLKPSVMRGLKKDAENQIFSELMVEAPDSFSSDRSMFDKLVRAQHYSLPTRLLDVSLNPLVALYFACNEEEHHDKDGALQLFDFNSNRIKFADSDAVSLICNLARLSDEEREEIAAAYRKVKKWNSLERKIFNEVDAVQRLIQFVRVEKPYFLNQVKPFDLFRYFFVFPAKSNRRVIAQSGAFIATGLLQYRYVGRSPGFQRSQIIIPAKAKPEILKELDVVNINSGTMFPEVEFVAKYIKKKWVEES